MEQVENKESKSTVELLSVEEEEDISERATRTWYYFYK